MAADPNRVVRLVGWIFLLVGLGMTAAAVWTGWQKVRILQSWPSVEATVTDSRISDRMGDRGRRLYGAAISFRYGVGGETYEAPASFHYETSDPGEMRDLVRRYAPGSRHPVLINPADPRDIRMEAGYTPGFFLVTLVLGGLGAGFLFFAVLLLVTSRSPQASLCRSCGKPVERGRVACSHCGLTVSS